MYIVYNKSDNIVVNTAKKINIDDEFITVTDNGITCKYYARDVEVAKIGNGHIEESDGASPRIYSNGNVIIDPNFTFTSEEIISDMGITDIKNKKKFKRLKKGEMQKLIAYLTELIAELSTQIETK